VFSALIGSCVNLICARLACCAKVFLMKLKYLCTEDSRIDQVYVRVSMVSKDTGEVVDGVFVGKSANVYV